MECLKKDTCANYGAECHSCWSMSDIYNHYPFYTEKKTDSIKVKLLVSKDDIGMEIMINEFISDKNIIDIKYQAVPTANPPYVTNRALIIYKE